MASSAPPKQSAAAAAKPGAGSDPAADEPEDEAVGAQPRLKVMLRMSDIIQLNLVIGRSRFGEVKLARHRQTGEIYALKALRKSKCGTSL
jgi:hypothetical protein